MPQPTKGPRLGGGAAHERLILSNLATALFEHGRITTTEAKAKRLRPLAERMVTFAKRGDIHSRRRVLRVVRDKGVVHTLFAEIGPRYAERAGGYTRITKVGPRKGDNAPMAVIELVEALTVAQDAVGEAERARGARFRRPRKGAEAAPAAEATGATEAAEAAEGAEAVDVADSVPTAGDTDGVPETTEAQAPVPTEGDTEDGAQTAAEPADGVTSEQTEAAGETTQAEGDGT